MLSKVISSTDLIQIGNRIQEIRSERGWTQADLSARTKLASNTVSRIETAQMNFSVTSLCTIAAALEVSLEELAPKRLRKTPRKSSLASVEAKFAKLSTHQQALVLASLSAMIDGLLCQQEPNQ